MKNWVMGLCCLLLSATALASDSDKVRKSVQASMLLTGTIVVEPDGSVRSFAIDRADKVAPTAMALIKHDIPAWKFGPVLIAGKPVAAKAKMSLRVVAKPSGNGNYELRISGTNFGKEGVETRVTSQSVVPPRYPSRLRREHVSGTVYLVLRVGRNGNVENVAAEQVNLDVIGSDKKMTRWRKMLAESALSAMRQWTFKVTDNGNDVDQAPLIVRKWVRYQLGYSSFPAGPIPRRGRASELDHDDYGQWQAYIPGPKQPIPWIADKRLLSGSPDASPSSSVVRLDHGGMHLLTPLSEKAKTGSSSVVGS